MKGQVSVEYLAILAAVLIVGIVGVFVVQGSAETNANDIAILSCQSAARECAFLKRASSSFSCDDCKDACLNFNRQEIFPGAIDCCMAGNASAIYENSTVSCAYASPSLGCVDNDGDLFNASSIDCPSGNDCDDFNVDVNPDENEICDNFIDDDCDNLIDCNDLDCEASAVCGSIEICDNGIDDDGDTFVDCDDDDCSSDPACGSIEICDNEIDDDGDTFTDCADPDCSTAPNCDSDLIVELNAFDLDDYFATSEWVINEIYVEEGYAYLATDKGLVIVNVTDYSNLEVLHSPVGGGVCNDVDKLGNHIYLACGNGLFTFSYNDPVNPPNPGYSDTSFYPLDLSIDYTRDYLYAAGGDGGLRIYDIHRSSFISLLYTIDEVDIGGGVVIKDALSVFAAASISPGSEIIHFTSNLQGTAFPRKVIVYRHRDDSTYEFESFYSGNSDLEGNDIILTKEAGGNYYSYVFGRGFDTVGNEIDEVSIYELTSSFLPDFNAGSLYEQPDEGGSSERKEPTDVFVFEPAQMAFVTYNDGFHDEEDGQLYVYSVIDKTKPIILERAFNETSPATSTFADFKDLNSVYVDYPYVYVAAHTKLGVGEIVP